MEFASNTTKEEKRQIKKYYLKSKPKKRKVKKKSRKKKPYNKKHEYNLYLKSKEWRDKRKDVLARDGDRCIFCFSDNDLHVHHLTYENFKNEPLSDLVTLCSVCHKGEHLKSKA
jgi:5-methylcytosine-specific restriction endonuclease McrA